MATTTSATMMPMPLLMAMTQIPMVLGDLLLMHLKTMATTLPPMVLMMTRLLPRVKRGMRRGLLWQLKTSCLAAHCAPC